MTELALLITVPVVVCYVIIEIHYRRERKRVAILARLRELSR